MDRCDFCPRPMERRLWARRWPVKEGRRQRHLVRDVRLALCREHLAQCVGRKRLLRKDDWAYG